MKKHQKTKKSPRSVDTQTVILQTERDFKDALLLISIAANLFILCLWMAMQVTTRYDNALSVFFFSR